MLLIRGKASCRHIFVVNLKHIREEENKGDSRYGKANIRKILKIHHFDLMNFSTAV